MKKNKLLVILSLALTLSCLLSALSMNAFAEALQNVYYVTNQEYTSLTNTYGYSSANFTGNYYDDDDDERESDAILACEVHGGPSSQYITELLIDFQGEGFVDLDSDDVNHRQVNATVSSTTIQPGYYACALESSSSTAGDGDMWERFYYAEWDGFPYGWNNYIQDPE